MTDKDPKKRRRVRKRDERPGEIIDAAMVEFSKNGYAATRMIDIARTAGAAKGTIYRYFPNKQSLFEAVITDRISASKEGVAGFAPPPSAKISDILAILIRRFYAQISEGEPGVILRILVAEGRHFPELVMIYHKQMMQTRPLMLKKLIQKGIDRGEFRADLNLSDPRVIIAPAIAANVLNLIFEGIDPIDLESYAESHIDLILNGLRAR